MKKLMMTTVAALGFAALAQAGVLNSTGFEDYGSTAFAVNTSDSGSPDSGTQYWTGTGDFSQTVLKTYGEDVVKPTNLPDDFETAGDYFLSVDTGNDVMYRKAGADAGSVDLTQGAVFFDADVKFTASETAVVPSEGDKLLVWLKGDDTTTNLIVTAGLYNESTEEYDQTNFTVVGDYAADTWYRLTVKAAVENNVTTFVVYIDGTQVSATYEDGEFDSFPSLVESGSDSGKLIEAAGFQGTGALDNVVWTTTDPFPAEATYTLTLEGAGDFDSVSVAGTSRDLEQDVSAQIGVSATEVTVELTTGTNGTVTPTTEAEGVMLGKVTKVVTKETDPEDPEGESWDVFTFTFTVTIAEPEAEAEYTIALAFEAGEEEVPTEGEAAAGESATVKAADAEAALEAVTVKVDDAVAAVLTAEQKAAFAASFFTKSFVDNQDGTYTVSVAVNGEAVEDALDVVVAEALETAADGEITTIPAGLCYKIESGSTVGLGTVAKGVSTGATIEVEGLTEAAGFYKVSLDVAPIE